MSEAYGDDLAYIHDVGFGGFATAAAPFLLDRLRRAGIADGLVLDLGCGSGLWARRLVDTGYQVRGIDLSPAMIELARRRVPEGRFEVGSFLDIELGRCRAVTALGEPLAYLFDGANSRRSLFRLLRRIHRALEPGGLLMFDLPEPGAGGPRGAHERAAHGDDWAIFFRAEEDEAGEILTRHLTTFRKTGRLYRRDHETHRLLLYRSSEVARELRRLGFKTQLVRGYGDLRLARRRAGFVARKP